jgi:hypothetical protein
MPAKMGVTVYNVACFVHFHSFYNTNRVENILAPSRIFALMLGDADTRRSTVQ